jgi:hypothetical protein
VPELEITAAEAQHFFDAGNLAVADALCRAVLGRFPHEETARSLLGRIADELGQEWHSRLLRGEQAEASAIEGDGKFVLVKAWGNGFFSDLDCVLGGLMVAEITGRTPVVHWGRNSLFGSSPDADAFRQFFEPVSALGIDDLIGKGHDYYPPKWNDANLRKENLNKLAGPGSRVSAVLMLGRPEKVVVMDYHTGVVSLLPWVPPGNPLYGMDVGAAYRWLMNKYLKPVPEVLERVEAFLAWFMPIDSRSPIVAAHIRAGDKWRDDPQIEAKNRIYPQVISQFGSQHLDHRIFLLTDSDVVRGEYAAKYGRQLITTDSIRTSDNTGIHLATSADRKRLGMEVLVDALLAARCDYFVGLGTSNVTCYIFHAKQWTNQNCLLIGQLMTHMPNPYLYMTHDQLERFLPPETIAGLRALADRHAAEAAAA